MCVPVPGVCLFMVATHKLYGIYSVINSINSHISGFVYGRFNASVILSSSSLSLAVSILPSLLLSVSFSLFGLVWFVLFLFASIHLDFVCFVKLNMLFKCHFQIETNVHQILLIASPVRFGAWPKTVCVARAI